MGRATCTSTSIRFGPTARSMRSASTTTCPLRIGGMPTAGVVRPTACKVPTTGSRYATALRVASASTGTTRATGIEPIAGARPSPMECTTSLGCFDPRISTAGGATGTSSGAAAWRSVGRPHGGRAANPSSLPSSARQRWTRPPTGRTSFPIPNPRKTRCPRSHRAPGTIWPSTPFCPLTSIAWKVTMHP